MGIPVDLRCEVQLLPSILSADFARLGEEVREVMKAGARIIHVDVMDGHFVPNITVGPLVVRAIAPEVHARGGYLSVHLMIENPERYAEEFVTSGADGVAIHAEVCGSVHHTLQSINSLGASAGVALNPASDTSRISELADLIDHVVVMTVNPGFGGQALIEPALDKVSEVRSLVRADVAIEVDGGVNAENIRRIVELGGNWVIAGSAVFAGGRPAEQVRTLSSRMVG